MDSNAFLLSFGMKPGDFDRAEGPLGSDDGFVHEAWAASSRWSENGWTGVSKKASKEIAKNILFCTQGEEGRGNPSPEFQKNSRIDLNLEGDSTIKKF